jgi:hypothetical protein
MRFRTSIEQSGKTATGIRVPDEIVEALGSGKRPPVHVTINGYAYRSTVAVLGEVYMVAVSAANRSGAGVVGGARDVRPPLVQRQVVARAVDRERQDG